eukprot:GEMP01052866.1.p1 GENE.GEMP01052866.1~~GEMP01052866.1.p1  ORF type:complete len:350 (+),score=29.08 GEMP01052866.1:61-1050(+)
MTIDLGKKMEVYGTVVQGRHDTTSQWVSQYKVQYSSNRFDWVTIQDTFYGARSDNNNTNYFQSPVQARYVKLIVKKWYGHISMRAGVIACAECVQPDLGALHIDVSAEILAYESFTATLRCATGYSGSPTVKKCARPFIPYTVDGGCTPDDCAQPDLSGLHINVSADTLTYESFNTTLRCAAGYSGSPTAEKCANPGTQYTVDGACTPDDCVQPDLGFLHVIVAAETLTYGRFAATLRCATGFSGSPSAKKCTKPGIQYAVEGACTPNAPATTTAPLRTTTPSPSPTTTQGPATVKSHHHHPIIDASIVIKVNQDREQYSGNNKNSALV